jgi:hypothetical protein
VQLAAGGVGHVLHLAVGVGDGADAAGRVESSDFDGDNDVDQSDFAILQRCFSGPNVQVNPNCAD